MAPKWTSTERKRSRCSIKDFIPVEDPPAELDNKHAEAIYGNMFVEPVEVADEIVKGDFSPWAISLPG